MPTQPDNPRQTRFDRSLMARTRPSSHLRHGHAPASAPQRRRGAHAAHARGHAARVGASLRRDAAGCCRPAASACTRPTTCGAWPAQAADAIWATPSAAWRGWTWRSCSRWRAPTPGAARPPAPARRRRSPAARPWRVAVIGAALAARLQRPALLRRLGRPCSCWAPLPTRPRRRHGVAGRTGRHAAGARAAPARRLAGVDAGGPGASPRYRRRCCTALPPSRRAPHWPPAARLAARAAERHGAGQWLQGVLQAAAPARPAAGDAAHRRRLPPRRWDDAALADFAGLSSTIACECPRHVAELLMQLSHFEAYSAECQHRSGRRRTARLPAAGGGHGARALRGRRWNTWRCTKG
jgi:hypothetical protein